MNRGEVWLAHVGRKRRPVLVLTRTEVIDVRALVTVAEVSTTRRGLAAEVVLDPSSVGLDRECVVNCDGIHTVPRAALSDRVGTLDDAVLAEVCTALRYAVGC